MLKSNYRHWFCTRAVKVLIGNDAVFADNLCQFSAWLHVAGASSVSISTLTNITAVQSIKFLSLRCFDTVGWATGRASGL